MAAEADHLVGHNILAFDLPQLRALHAGLGLLDMPALDTLHLNPLAFPAHPYHRLVKHYRDGGLIRTTHNDPLLDSQLTLQALEAQLTELRENTSPELLSAWHWLTAHEAGPAFDAFFTEVRHRPVPTPGQGREALRRFLAGKACRTAARELTATAEDSAWSAAYVTAWMSTAGTNSAIPPWVLQHHPDTAALARRLREENLHRPRLHLVSRDERRGEGADAVVRLRLLPPHAGRPGGTVAAGEDHRGGPAGPECPRGAANRHRQVALLPGPRPVGLRQDQRPHGRDLPAGGPDGRPAGRAGEARHNQRGQHQQPALDAGAQGRPRPGSCADRHRW